MQTKNCCLYFIFSKTSIREISFFIVDRDKSKDQEVTEKRNLGEINDEVSAVLRLAVTTSVGESIFCLVY